MNEVKSIEPIKTVDQQTVETLKELLKMAEEGRLQSLMFVDYYYDKKCGHGWAGRPNDRMIGEIETMKFKYLCEKNLTISEE